MQEVLTECLPLDRAERDLEIDLQYICTTIKQADVCDLNDSRNIYIHLFELLCKTEDNVYLQTRIEQCLERAIQFKLLALFKQNVNVNDSTLFSWIEFVQVHFKQFELFYNCALQPFIVFFQDENTTPFTIQHKHPFKMCTEQLQQLLHTYEPFLLDIVVVEVDTYINIAKSYLESSSTKEPIILNRYIQQSNYLKKWMEICKTFKLCTPNSTPYIGIKNLHESLISYLPKNFLTQFQCPKQVFSCLRKLVSMSIQHTKTFSPRSTKHADIVHSSLTEVCDHFLLREQWTMSSLCLHRYSDNIEDCKMTSIFFWQEMLDAFRNMDVKKCKLYYSQMYSDGHPLHSMSPFSHQCIQQYLCNYTKLLAHTLSGSTDSIRNIWTFIAELFDTENGRSLAFNAVVEILYSKNVNESKTEKEWVTGFYRILVESNKHIHSDICGFLSLWNYIKHKDVCLEELLVSHIQPAIMNRTLNVSLHDHLLIQCIESYHSQSTRNYESFRDMLSEYQHRSFHKDAFVLKQDVWKQLPQHKHITNHRFIHYLLQKETEQFNSVFDKRSIEWNNWMSMCTTEYTWQLPDDTSIQIQIHTNLTIANICMHIHEHGIMTLQNLMERCSLYNGVVLDKDSLCQVLNVLIKENILENVSEDNSHNSPRQNYVEHLKHFVKLKMPEKSVSKPIQISNDTLQFISEVLTLQKQVKCANVVEKKKLLYEKKNIVQSQIVKHLKARFTENNIEHMSKNVLFDSVKKHNSIFEVGEELFESALETLQMKDYIAYDKYLNGFIYVP